MRTFQEQNTGGSKRLRRDEKPDSGKSGPGGPAARIIGPVAIEAGHAPFDALAEGGKAAVLDDRIMHGAPLAVADHDIGAAIAARNIVRLPGPERGFMDLAIGGDLQRGIPEFALLLLKLRGDGPQRRFAPGHPPVIARTE